MLTLLFTLLELSLKSWRNLKSFSKKSNNEKCRDINSFHNFSLFLSLLTAKCGHLGTLIASNAFHSKRLSCPINYYPITPIQTTLTPAGMGMNKQPLSNHYAPIPPTPASLSYPPHYPLNKPQPTPELAPIQSFVLRIALMHSRLGQCRNFGELFKEKGTFLRKTNGGRKLLRKNYWRKNAPQMGKFYQLTFPAEQRQCQVCPKILIKIQEKLRKNWSGIITIIYYQNCNEK